MKLTTNGTVTWAKTLTISGMDYGRPTECIAVDDDGNVYFGGSVRMTGDNEDTAVYGKLNSSGVVQCRKIGPVTNGGFSIKFLHDQDQSIVFIICSDSNGYNGAYVMCCLIVDPSLETLSRLPRVPIKQSLIPQLLPLFLTIQPSPLCSHYV